MTLEEFKELGDNSKLTELQLRIQYGVWLEKNPEVKERMEQQEIVNRLTQDDNYDSCENCSA